MLPTQSIVLLDAPYQPIWNNPPPVLHFSRPWKRHLNWVDLLQSSNQVCFVLNLSSSFEMNIGNNPAHLDAEKQQQNTTSKNFTVTILTVPLRFSVLRPFFLVVTWSDEPFSSQNLFGRWWCHVKVWTPPCNSMWRKRYGGNLDTDVSGSVWVWRPWLDDKVDEKICLRDAREIRHASKWFGDGV